MYYIHNDQLGTPQKISNASQQVVWAADHEPFGKVSLTVNNLTFDTRFPGQHYDAESSLHYNYFRAYDPEIGRYIQSDPIGLGDGVNAYGYVMGNPVIYTDRFGLLIDCKTIGYTACNQAAKQCTSACMMSGSTTVCTFPYQCAQSKYHQEVDEKYEKEEDPKPPKNPESPSTADPLTPEYTFEKWNAGLCGA